MYECEVSEGEMQDMLMQVSLAYTACMRHKIQCVFAKSGWMVVLASVTICRVKADVLAV